MEEATTPAPRGLVLGFLTLFVIVDVCLLIAGARQLWRVHELAGRGVSQDGRIVAAHWDDGYLRVTYAFRLRHPDGTESAETAIALLDRQRAKSITLGADTRIRVVPDDPSNSDLEGNPEQWMGAWWGILIASLQLVFVGIFAAVTLKHEA
jgi:hypothetical protein